jgi:hypothetical protein
MHYQIEVLNDTALSGKGYCNEQIRHCLESYKGHNRRSSFVLNKISYFKNKNNNK